MDKNEFYDKIADNTRDLFGSFLRAGFTREEALELIQSQQVFAIAIDQIQEEMRRKRRASERIKSLNKEETNNV